MYWRESHDVHTQTRETFYEKHTHCNYFHYQKYNRHCNYWMKNIPTLEKDPIPQFYIQLVYKPQFGTWILLIGPFWQLRAVSGFEFFRFWGWFFQFFVGKKFFYFFKKHCSVRTKKLQLIKFKNNFFDTWKKNYKF